MSDLTLSQKLRVLLATCSLGFAAMFFAGCGATLSPSTDPMQEAGAAKNSAGALGLLQVGDLLKIDFSGPNNPPQSVEQNIKTDGTISLYLVDTIKAAGKTPGDLQKEIQ